jgi:molybdopterin-containing oxidoreductase family iron-sulfur binding subunit
MARWGMAIDLDRCTGCQACVVACKQENNVPFSTPQQAEKGRQMSWIYMQTEVEGEYPNVKVRFRPMLCQHCDRPPCTFVCPTSATYKNQEGVVAQIYPRCIGCRYCANACPYAVKYFNYDEPVWPKQLEASLNHDVSVRYKGVIEKCTFCSHRRTKAQEQADAEGRELRDEDYQPACVQSCPANAMVFGDLDNPHSQVAEWSESPRAERLLEDLGTKPKVIYLKGGV